MTLTAKRRVHVKLKPKKENLSNENSNAKNSPNERTPRNAQKIKVSAQIPFCRHKLVPIIH